jgi:hypothetical protein
MEKGGRGEEHTEMPKARIERAFIERQMQCIQNKS